MTIHEDTSNRILFCKTEGKCTACLGRLNSLSSSSCYKCEQKKTSCEVVETECRPHGVENTKNINIHNKTEAQNQNAYEYGTAISEDDSDICESSAEDEIEDEVNKINFECDTC